MIVATKSLFGNCRPSLKKKYARGVSRCCDVLTPSPDHSQSVEMEQDGNSSQQQHHEHERGILQVNHRSKTADRTKRDEWSKDAVATLLDAYEAKWVVRNRAKLKGNDWEEVAQHVCARNGGSRTFKTQSQCKNKIEALKKRYRSAEATSVGASTWGLFARMDVLLRCSGGLGQGTKEQQEETMMPQVGSGDSEQVIKRGKTYLDEVVPDTEEVRPVPQLLGGGNADHHLIHHRHLQQFQKNHHRQQLQKEPNLYRQQGQLRERSQDEEEDASNMLPQEQVMTRKEELSFTSKIVHAIEGSGKSGGAGKRRKKSSGRAVAESFRWFAESILKLEQAKLESLKDSQRLRAEAEARRLEMELQRTQIIVQTQLQIAKFLSAKNHFKRKLASHKQASINNDNAAPP